MLLKKRDLMGGLLNANAFHLKWNIAILGGFPANFDSQGECTGKIFNIKGVNKIFSVVKILIRNMELLELFYVKLVENIKSTISVNNKRSYEYSIYSQGTTFEASLHKSSIILIEGLGTPSTVYGQPN